MNRGILPWILVALLLGVIVGRIDPGGAEEPKDAAGGAPEVTDTIRVRKLEIVDEHGKARILLDVHESGVARVQIFDEGGPTLANDHPRAYWAMGEDGHSEIAFIAPGSDGHSVRLGSVAHGVPSLAMGNKNGVVFEAVAGRTGGASLSINRPERRPGIRLQMLGPENESVISMADKDGVATFRLSLLRKGGAALRVGSGNGRAAFRFEPSADKGELQFLPLDLGEIEGK